MDALCGRFKGVSFCLPFPMHISLHTLWVQICGEEAGEWSSEREYVACKGSKPDSRGFTCGMWLLFHTAAARWALACSPDCFN